MKEEIRIIPWTNGRYGVSNLGNVYSYFDNHGIKRKFPKVLKQNNSLGYRTVRIINPNGNRKTMKVHRLVALTFIPNPDNLKQVNHKNENKADNRVENLEWCTAKYNNNYGSRREKSSIAQRGHKAKWFGVYKTEHPRYRKICPLVLYTMITVKKMSYKSIKKELKISNNLLKDRIKTYNLI